MSLLRLNTSALAPRDPSPLELSLDNGDESNKSDRDSLREHMPVRHVLLSDEVVGLREWGASQMFSLRVPQHPRQATTMSTSLQVSGRDRVIAACTVEISYENESWHIRDRRGLASLKQEGKPTRDAILVAGTEVGIGGRTLIAESARSIALRNFCFRLIGWADGRVAVVEQALRAIRLASSGRAALILSGSGDLVPVAHAIHRRIFGDEVPFVVCNRRRLNMPATVRSPVNCACGMEAVRMASRGSLCVRTGRLPKDFADVVSACRDPQSGVQLVVCTTNRSTVPGAGQIDIPSLKTRRLELPRIVSEYGEDIINMLGAHKDCLNRDDVDWIIKRATFERETTMSDIEKTVLRTVVLRMTNDLSIAAKCLGMARVSLERWFRRRTELTRSDVTGGM